MVTLKCTLSDPNEIKAKLTQSLHTFSKGGNREYHLSLWCGWAGGNKLTERLTLLQKGLN